MQDPGGGTLTLKTKLEREAASLWACLIVSDTGCGIDASVLPRIFEPFFTTKPVGKGTGLGLSLAFDIVQKHGGVIDAFSKPGATEFRIKLPVTAKTVGQRTNQKLSI
jgi:signal transduction histidine kinase